MRGRVELIRLENACFGYGSEPVLKNVSISVARGSSLALLGPSGSGKSTILAGMAGMLASSHGQVLFDGKDLGRLRPAELAEHRLRDFGFVFQRSGLLEELSLVENVALPARLAGARSADALGRAEALLDDLGIERDVRSRRPAEVSGGQEQRAAVARALINAPKVIFADEPTGALDEENSQVVGKLLVDAAARNGATLVMATHNADLVRGFDSIMFVHRAAVTSERP